MDSIALLIDFGSTYTKVVAVDLARCEVIGRAQAASTVDSDVRDGLLRALAALPRAHGLFDAPPTDLEILRDRVVLASSSAAGGLRMAVVGLVPGLTVEAANVAALGAGAKVVGSWSFKLARQAVDEIAAQRPDMILLTGGADGGDAATILHNARLLARSSLSVPVVIAGNRIVAGEIMEIFREHGREGRVAPNVLPRAGELAVDGAREEIRSLFMERITRAKGLEAMREIVPVILPTPMAVLQAALVGARSAAGEAGGDLVVVDVGGATTDVHSIGYGKATGPSVVEPGLPEPFAKRTVEGDLGIRFNAATLVDRVGFDRFEREFRAAFPACRAGRDELRAHIDEISRETGRVPRLAWEHAVDAELARIAVDLALERHVGRKERIVLGAGEAWMQHGKDLTEAHTLIGTGGVFLYNAHAAHVFEARQRADDRTRVLRPKNPRLFVDAGYLLYAIGLLSENYPETAARLFEKYMKRIG